MNSRKNGDNLEYSLITLLINKGYTFYNNNSHNRFKKLQNKCCNTPCKLDNLKIPFDAEKFNYIKIMKDTAGCIGNSNDIEVYDKEKKTKIGISLKYNNMSIKAPRANSMGKCMPQEFTDEYLKLNAEWYNGFVEEKIDKFKECTKSSINEIYESFIDITIPYITIKNFLNLVTFCTSINYTDYIIHRHINGKFTVYKNNFKPRDGCSFSVVKKQSNTFLLYFDRYCLSFRLHTASSSVTPKLSLKYDVKYVGESPLEIVE